MTDGAHDGDILGSPFWKSLIAKASNIADGARRLEETATALWLHLQIAA